MSINNLILIKIKKVLFAITFFFSCCYAYSAEKVLHREKSGCLGNRCGDTRRTLIPMNDWSGDGKTDWGVFISCSGAGFSYCPISITPASGGNDGEWDECTITASENLIEYGETQIGQGNNSGEHTITITSSGGCSATYKIVFSGNYSDENNSWDIMDVNRQHKVD